MDSPRRLRGPTHANVLALNEYCRRLPVVACVLQLFRSRNWDRSVSPSRIICLLTPHRHIGLPDYLWEQGGVGVSKATKTQQAYGRDYQFSGTVSPALPVPTLLAPYLAWAKAAIDPR